MLVALISLSVMNAILIVGIGIIAKLPKGTAPDPLADGFLTRLADVEVQVAAHRTDLSGLRDTIELRHNSLTQLILRKTRSKAEETADMMDALASASAPPIVDPAQIEIPALNGDRPRGVRRVQRI